MAVPPCPCPEVWAHEQVREPTVLCSLVYLSSLVVLGLTCVVFFFFLLSPLCYVPEKDWAQRDQLHSPSWPQAFLQCYSPSQQVTPETQAYQMPQDRCATGRRSWAQKCKDPRVSHHSCLLSCGLPSATSLPPSPWPSSSSGLQRRRHLLPTSVGSVLGWSISCQEPP